MKKTRNNKETKKERGSWVEVREGAKKGERNPNGWTEEIESTDYTVEGEIYYHTSSETIDSFAPVETCFYADTYAPTGHIYAIQPPAGTPCRVLMSGEVRFVLQPGWKLQYLGYAEIRRTWDENGRVRRYADKSGVIDFQKEVVK